MSEPQIIDAYVDQQAVKRSAGTAPEGAARTSSTRRPNSQRDTTTRRGSWVMRLERAPIDTAQNAGADA